jgi:hypothetical protein
MVSQSNDESDWRQAQTEVMRLVESGNFPAAISYLEAGKDAVTVSANYIRFAQSLYNERKDVVDLAGQCLRLVEELKLGNIRLGKAYWLIGALAVARGLGADADEAFEHAQSAFHAEGAHVSELMVQGYRALLRMRQPRFQDLGAVEFGEVRQRLKEDGSKEALFYLQQQLTTADRLLWPSTPSTA